MKKTSKIKNKIFPLQRDPRCCNYSFCVNSIGIKRSGFTLIELLVVVAIFGVIGTIATVTLFSLLRGASKTEIIKEVKQNGDYALSVMETKIRNSTIDDVNCIGMANNLIIKNNDGTYTTYDCVADGAINRLRSTTSGISGYLTNSQVSLADCNTTNISFTCTNLNANKTVSIMFTLKEAGSTTDVANKSSATFQTQIALRNN